MTHTLVYPITARHNDAGHLEIDGCDIVDLVDEFGTPLIVYEEKIHPRPVPALHAGVCGAHPRLRDHLRQQGVLVGGDSPVGARRGPLHRRVLRRRVPRGQGGRLPAGEDLLPRQQQDPGRARIRPRRRRGLRGHRQLPGTAPCSTSSWRAGASGRRCCCASRRASRRTRTPTSRPGRWIPSSVSGWTKAWPWRPSAEAMAAPHLDLVGLHAHIGSQIFELDGFRKAIEILVGLIAQANEAFGFECRYLNIGGGLGIRYTEEDTPSSIGDYAAVKVEGVREEMAARACPCRGCSSSRAAPSWARRVSRPNRGHHQGDPRRPYLRERRRGHERQHPAHALRRALRGHAG